MDRGAGGVDVERAAGDGGDGGIRASDVHRRRAFDFGYRAVGSGQVGRAAGEVTARYRARVEDGAAVVGHRIGDVVVGQIKEGVGPDRQRARAESVDVTRGERAAADRGAAGIAVGPRERDGAGPGLEQAVGIDSGIGDDGTQRERFPCSWRKRHDLSSSGRSALLRAADHDRSRLGLEAPVPDGACSGITDGGIEPAVLGGSCGGGFKLEAHGSSRAQGKLPSSRPDMGGAAALSGGEGRGAADEGAGAEIQDLIGARDHRAQQVVA